VILDEEFRRVARLLLAVAEAAAGQDEIAGEDRRAAFAHQALADDRRPDPAPVEFERRVAPRRTAAHHHHVRRVDSHSASRHLCPCRMQSRPPPLITIFLNFLAPVEKAPVEPKLLFNRSPSGDLR
jgi:hypothetical protein